MGHALLFSYLQATPLSELLHFGTLRASLLPISNETHGRSILGWPKKHRHCGGMEKEKGSKENCQTDNLLINIPLFHPAQPSVVQARQVSLRDTEYPKFYGCWNTRAIRRTWGVLEAPLLLLEQLIPHGEGFLIYCFVALLPRLLVSLKSIQDD